MMKKFLASMLMMASITAASEAAPLSSASKAAKAQASVMVPYRNDVYDMMKTSHDNFTLAAKYNPISTGNYFKTNEWGMNNAYTNPFVYEPKSGYLFAMHRAGGDAGTIGMVYSTDNGATWNGPTVVFTKTSTYPVNVSFAVTNPSNSKNLADMRFVIVAPYAELTSTDQTEWKGAMYLLMSDITNPTTAQSADFWGPVDNNPGSQQRWWSTGMLSSVVDGKEYFYNYGMLAAATNAPYGHYGFSQTEMTPGKEDVPVSTIPTQWALSKFKPADDPTKGSWNNPIVVDCDAAGNLYAVVNNAFADDIENRVVAVSKSVDQGASWSEFERSPVDLLSKYVASRGGDLTLNSFIIPYDGDGFTVTGTDEFSYLCKAIYDITDTSNTSEYIEVYKKSGTWGIRFIAEGTGWVLQCIDHEGLTADATEYDTPFYAENPRGNEMQLSKTADGNYIVAKWIEYADRFGSSPITIKKRKTDTKDDLYDYTEVTLDTIFTSDVYIAYRAVNSTEWKTVNATNDPEYFNKSTFIPRIVPSINNIPLFALGTGSTISSTFPDEAAWSSFFKQMITDHSQSLTYTKIDVDNLPSGVNEDKENSNLSISAITPNPATSSATINFNVETPGVASVKVFNVMGQEVATLFNSYVGNGKYITSFDATKVNEGTYYVTLVINGKSTTKVLNVVK